MTIVLQHWFEGLDVREDGFSVTLNFGDSPETLSIPWDAMRTFVDPSVDFGLRFDARDDRKGDDGEPARPSSLPVVTPRPRSVDSAPGGTAAKKGPDGDAEVVQLDKFRK